MTDFDNKMAILSQLESKGISNTSMPDIYFIPGDNPVISTSNSPQILQFKQTKETLLNIDDYRQFLENAISNFRKTRTYKNYKAFLMNLGLDRCQVHGNITSDMATLEMHHNMLTIFDIAYIITAHMTTVTDTGLSTFDLVYLLKKAHKEHKVQLVMLSLTPHQLYHNTDQLEISPQQCIGDWYGFLQEYQYGISKEIAYKILFYLKEFKDEDFGPNYDILKIAENITKWSDYNTRINSLPSTSSIHDAIFNPYAINSSSFDIIY